MIFQKLYKTLSWLWQLPQHIIAQVLILFSTKVILNNQGLNFKIYLCPIFIKNSGLSLGKYILVGKGYNNNIILHELGHTIQSRYWGPLYLLIIGIPSVIRFYFYNIFHKNNKLFNYENVWFERQATLLGIINFKKQVQ